MRRLLYLVAALLPVTVHAQEPPSENIAHLVRTALTANPEVKTAEARWDMYLSRAKQADAWEDPMLMLKIQNGMVRKPFDFNDDDMTQKVIGISQQIPYKGKLAAKLGVAEKEAEAARWQHGEKKMELTRMVKETYYGVYFVDRSADVIRRNIDILDNFIKLAETKYAVGQGVQQDVIKAQVERSKMLEMQINLQQQRKELEARLNSLLHRPSATPFGTVDEPATAGPAQTEEELLQIALANRPMLKELEARIEKAKAAEKVARIDYYPDFNVSFEYMQRDSRDDMYSLGVTFNLPVRKARRDAMVAEARSEALMAAEELNAAKNEITRSIGSLKAQIERRKKLIELYSQGLIPQARQSLESAMIAYRVGKVDFLTLLDSRMALYGYEREYYESVAELRMKVAELEAVVGQDLR